MTAVSAPVRHQPVDFRLVTWIVAMGAVVNAFHWDAVLVVALPLAVLAVIPTVGRSPLPWLAAAVAFVPLGVIGWDRLEDHVYFGAYLILAVGIALTRVDPRSSFREQARLLTGSLFAIAVAWKVASVAFLRGDVFHTVLTYDGRFDPLSRWFGGLDQSAVDANRAALEAMEQSTATLDAVAIDGGAQVGILLMGLVAWTLLVEVAAAASFLAPDRHRLARLRHPALIAFGLSTYPFVPVVGFALMFTAVGLVLTDDPRVQPFYLAITFSTLASLALRAVF